ncbi:unnamed protein product [Dibothriocephalus latus]|uniref:ATP citrate synthase n=1 Tax=Dibothriocephalus latus TaxID=60516 RepID=A0A3P6QPR1_DIBLA|nr:unnamed protein product [Dibothriocephalus latus]
MSNELNNIIALNTDGVAEGVAIGGDRFPGSTFLDHILRYEADPSVHMLVLLGEGDKVKFPLRCMRVFVYRGILGVGWKVVHWPDDVVLQAEVRLQVRSLTTQLSLPILDVIAWELVSETMSTFASNAKEGRGGRQLAVGS